MLPLFLENSHQNGEHMPYGGVDTYCCGSNSPRRAKTHQTLQTLSGGFTIGWPALHENACANSGIFTTTPLMRYCADECGSVIARTRRSSSRMLEQSHCAKPTKKRCSGVSPSIGCRLLFFVASFHAMRARISPPRSATFSPRVSSPLM